MGMHIYFYHILERLLKQPFPHKVIGCYCGEGSLPEYELVPWTAQKRLCTMELSEN